MNTNLKLDFLARWFERLPAVRQLQHGTEPAGRQPGRQDPVGRLLRPGRLCQPAIRHQRRHAATLFLQEGESHSSASRRVSQCGNMRLEQNERKRLVRRLVVQKDAKIIGVAVWEHQLLKLEGSVGSVSCLWQ